MQNITISTDKQLLNINYIHDFLKNTYWAKDRTIATQQVLIDNSLCFGVYLTDKQIGFARVVTDYAQLAYIMDVFIDESHRGKGYFKRLMHYILEALPNVLIWRLATSDAHKLYAQFGFQPIKNPEKLMELVKKAM